MGKGQTHSFDNMNAPEIRAWENPVLLDYRVDSNRNQARRSASSIQTSIELVVA